MIPMEAEVPLLFLVCFGIVFLGKIFLGSVFLWKCASVRILWIGHLLSELAAFYYLLSVLFDGRIFSLNWPSAMYSEHASVHIGLFGVCWAIATLLLVYIIFRLNKKEY